LTIFLGNRKMTQKVPFLGGGQIRGGKLQNPGNGRSVFVWVKVRRRFHISSRHRRTNFPPIYIVLKIPLLGAHRVFWGSRFFPPKKTPQKPPFFSIFFSKKLYFFPLKLSFFLKISIFQYKKMFF
jgi:hypothetical protein